MSVAGCGSECDLAVFRPESRVLGVRQANETLYQQNQCQQKEHEFNPRSFSGQLLLAERS